MNREFMRLLGRKGCISFMKLGNTSFLKGQREKPVGLIEKWSL